MVPSDASPAGSRDDLPLPDYDHLPMAGLIQRIRSLDADQLKALDAYEREHGNRLPVTEAFRARLAELAAGAEPSGGSPFGVRAGESAWTGSPAANRPDDRSAGQQPTDWSGRP